MQLKRHAREFQTKQSTQRRPNLEDRKKWDELAERELILKENNDQNKQVQIKK